MCFQGRWPVKSAKIVLGLLRNCPCHVELILSEKGETVEKAEEEARCSGVKPKKFTRKQFAKLRLKACKAQGVDLRVHYKNTYETAQAIKGMTLSAAKQYLQDVCDKKRRVCIVFRKYRGTIGRTPQAKEFKATQATLMCFQGRWPVKSAKIVLGLLRNCPCHVELILSEKGETVEKAEEEARCFGVKPKKFTRKQFAKLRLKVRRVTC
eukprot:Skav214021  [mRNA]  locus=scaffold3389:11675:15223:- [translate_table: standard]